MASMMSNGSSFRERPGAQTLKRKRAVIRSPWEMEPLAHSAKRSARHGSMPEASHIEGNARARAVIVRAASSASMGDLEGIGILVAGGPLARRLALPGRGHAAVSTTGAAGTTPRPGKNGRSFFFVVPHGL